MRPQWRTLSRAPSDGHSRQSPKALRSTKSAWGHRGRQVWCTADDIGRSRMHPGKSMSVAWLKEVEPTVSPSAVKARRAFRERLLNAYSIIITWDRRGHRAKKELGLSCPSPSHRPRHTGQLQPHQFRKAPWRSLSLRPLLPPLPKDQALASGFPYPIPSTWMHSCRDSEPSHHGWQRL